VQLVVFVKVGAGATAFLSHMRQAISVLDGQMAWPTIKNDNYQKRRYNS